MLSGQISFKKYSAEDIEKKSKDNFQNYFKWKHYRIGKEKDFLEDYFKVEAYVNFYECLEDQIKEEINSKLETKCKTNSLKDHVRCYKEEKCNWCEEFQILRECAPKIEW